MNISILPSIADSVSGQSKSQMAFELFKEFLKTGRRSTKKKESLYQM